MSGREADTTAQCLWVLVANVDVWGPQAQQYIANSSFHVSLVSEHRLLRGASLNSAVLAMKAQGWRMVASPATLKYVQGSGGTAVLSKATLQVGRGAMPEYAGAATMHNHRFWTSQVLKLRGCDVLLVAPYLLNGVGPAAQNLDAVQALCAHVGAFEIPFVAAGDWNMTPEELASTGILHHLRATIVRPKNLEWTCKIGSRRLLDFVVVSARFAEAIAEAQGDMQAPFATHQALRFGMHREPRQIHTLHLVKQWASATEPSTAPGIWN